MFFSQSSAVCSVRRLIVYTLLFHCSANDNQHKSKITIDKYIERSSPHKKLKKRLPIAIYNIRPP